MIGNDVVDLELAQIESNWRRTGFLNRVFYEYEQDKILSATNQDVMVWLLWSMKEAAYKAHQRLHDLPRKLDWKRQKTFLESCSANTATGRVKIDESYYTTASEITRDFIHTSAVSGEINDLQSGVFRAASAVAKEQLLEVLSEAEKKDRKKLSFQKNKYGVPFIYFEGQVLTRSFSLSSHGIFSAYSAR